MVIKADDECDTTSCGLNDHLQTKDHDAEASNETRADYTSEIESAIELTIP